jgi:hypothetical protein
VPAEPRYRRVARAAAAACATLEAFSMDEIADLRLLVDETFRTLETAGAGPITMCLHPAHGALDLEISSSERGHVGWTGADLEVLGAVVAVIGEAAHFDQQHGRLALRVRVVGG